MIDWLDNAIQRRRRGDVDEIDVELARIERGDGRFDRHADYQPPIPDPKSLDVLRPSSLEPAARHPGPLTLWTLATVLVSGAVMAVLLWFMPRDKDESN